VGKLPLPDGQGEEALRTLARRLLGRWQHPLLKQLRRRESDTAATLDLLRRAYGLEDEDEP
jgi:hypothetical protein